MHFLSLLSTALGETADFLNPQSVVSLIGSEKQQIYICPFTDNRGF